MPNTSENNRRIARNTLLLYVRMLFTMGVSLYTSRVVLSILGVDDFGIYSVVGGLVAMFTMVSAPLSAGISRFLTIELGLGNFHKMRQIFANSLSIQLMIAAAVIVLGETAGLWFLNAKMNITPERMEAANWVLQCTLFTFALSLLGTPYEADIIARERMQVFAYLSIVEVSLKLGVVYLLSVAPMDALSFYALMLLGVALAIRAAYMIYCRRHFTETRVGPHFDKEIMRQMLGFSGWNFIGASSSILRDGGVNLVINIFCGVAVNAARGVAVQVNTAVNGFVQNFMVALNPQITKSYATGDHDYMFTLIYKGARFSYYLLLLLSLPIIVSADYVLGLWLKEVPDHTGMFVRLILIFALMESISNPLITAMLATGRIKNYQLVVGGLQLLNLPVSYVLLLIGFPPEATLLAAIAISACCLAARIFMLRGMIGLRAGDFMRRVVLNVVMVTIVSAAVPAVVAYFAPDTFANFLLITAVCVGFTIVTEFKLGCNAQEQEFILAKIKGFYHKRLAVLTNL